MLCPEFLAYHMLWNDQGSTAHARGGLNCPSVVGPESSVLEYANKNADIEARMLSWHGAWSRVIPLVTKTVINFVYRPLEQIR